MLTLKNTFIEDSMVTTRKLCVAISLLLIVMFDQSCGYPVLEGSNCKLKNDSFGVCVKITECTTVLNALISGEMNFDDMVHCSFVGTTQVICCDRTPTYTSQNITTSTQIPDQIMFFDKDNTLFVPQPTTEKTTKVTTVSRIGGKADIACEQYSNLTGPSLTYHILDGLPTTPGEFPHMVALGYGVIETSTKDIAWDCGGSLISEKFVLTAAHCVNSRRDLIVVRLGANDLNSDSDFVDSNISEIIRHPRYRSSRLYYDIALIRLEKTMEFNFYIRPACLNTNLTEFTSKETLIATGWGVVSLKTRKRSSVLLQANLTSVDIAPCNASFIDYGLDSRISNGIRPQQLCAYDSQFLRDTCEGDSGGPLQIKTSQNSYIIVGITSFGIFCGSSIPGVYTKVLDYLNWIENIVW